MELLPKTHKQFQEETYWQKFFKGQQTNKGFEWYASYEELEYLLKQTIKNESANILIPGCGNSHLSEKLHLNMKLNNILSLDFEENVINKMNQKGFPIQFKVGDMLDMKDVQPDSMDFVIDKGSFDALCSDQTEETKKKCFQYLNEIQRVLKTKGGAYVIVSLLQDFVFETLIEYFCKGASNNRFEDFIIDFRIQKIEKVSHLQEDGSALVPFYLTIKQTLIDKSQPKMVEFRQKLSNIINFQDSIKSKSESLDIEGAKEAVSREQVTAMYGPKLRDLSLGQKYELFCYDKKTNKQTPRYILTVLDSQDSKILKKRSCAAFITPQGKERESMFATEVGRWQLVKQAGYSRLIMIVLNHGHQFTGIEQVKEEMSAKVLDLAPRKCSNLVQIPFLSIGQSIGEREEIYRSPDNSIIVEDNKDQDGDIFRQVIFMSKPEMVQSEVLLVYKNSKKGELPEHLIAQSKIAPKKKQRVLAFNHDKITNEYQTYMLSGFGLNEPMYDKEKIRVLVLGTGAGLLPMFLRSQMRDVLQELVTVDINEEMVRVGKEYFGFKEDEVVKSVIGDAYQFVEESKGDKFDAIFMDINYEEKELGMSPPFKFVESRFLDKLLGMTSDQGFVTFNLLCYEQETFNRVQEEIKASQAKGRIQLDGNEDLNKVIILSKCQILNQSDRVPFLEKLFKKWKVNKGIWLNDLQIKEQLLKMKEF